MNNIKEKLSQVKEFFSSLEFDAEAHSYKSGGRTLCSVSSTIKQYVEYVDFERIAFFVAKKRSKEEGITYTAEMILQEWEDKKNNSCNMGNEAHLFGENFTKDSIPKTGFDKAIKAFWESLPEHIIPFCFELQMFSLEFGLAGTSDIILYNTKTNKFIIADYKGLPLDTDILTDSGWKTMGTLVITDKVFDKEGKLCNIKNISSIHNKKCLEIIFDNNESITSDFEHRWLINKGNNKNQKVMTTQEIKDYLDTNKNPLSYNTLRIYNPKPLDLEKKVLPIDPYLLGVWLGDGHSIDGKITQMNSVVWEELENRGYTLGKDISQGGAGKAQTRTVFGLENLLRKNNLKSNKHIPKEYLLSSYEQRLDLLRGFMDADGYYNKSRKRFVMATTRKSQVDFFIELLSSLGLKPTIIECNKYCNNKIFKGWDVCFTTDTFNPFLCRNQDISIKVNKENTYRRIVMVREVEQVPTKCIEVDSYSHTYLATKSLIVTHNTNEDLFRNHKGKTLLAPFGTLLDNPISKYVLQLSYYQILFEQLGKGFEVESRRIIWVKPDGTFIIYETKDYTKELLTELNKQNTW
jgi:hypothetical protein